MGIEDLLNQAPIDTSNPADLGVPAPPVLPSVFNPGDLGLPPMPAPAPPVALATPPQPSNVSTLALLASALIAAHGGHQAAGTGLLQGVQAGQDYQTHEFLQEQQRQQDAAHLQAVQTEQQQKAYQGEVDKRGAQLTGVLTKLKTDLQKVPTADAANALIDQYGQTLTAAGYRGFDGNSLRAKGYRYLAPALEPQLYKQLDALFKNPANKGAVDSGDVMNGIVQYTDPSDGLKHTMPVKDAITAANYPISLGPDGKPFKVADKPLTPDQVFGQAGLVKSQFEKLVAGGADPKDPQTMITAQEKARAKPAPINISVGAGDTTDMAQQLVDRKLVPSMLSKRTANYNAILAEANRLSKEQTGEPYDAAKAQVEYAGATRFAASLNGSQMVRFQGLGHSVVNTIDEVRRLSEALDNSGVQFANRLEMEGYLKLNSNSPKGQLIAQYLGATNTLKEEFANLVNGGMAPTEPAFALANKQINENYGVKALNASLSETQRLINYRLNSFTDLRPMAAGDGSATPPPAPAAAGPTIGRFQIVGQ